MASWVERKQNALAKILASMIKADSEKKEINIEALRDEVMIEFLVREKTAVEWIELAIKMHERANNAATI